MVAKFMQIENDDLQNYTFCRLKLVVETLKHLNYWTNQTPVYFKF